MAMGGTKLNHLGIRPSLQFFDSIMLELLTLLVHARSPEAALIYFCKYPSFQTLLGSYCSTTTSIALPIKPKRSFILRPSCRHNILLIHQSRLDQVPIYLRFPHLPNQQLAFSLDPQSAAPPLLTFLEYSYAPSLSNCPREC
jgi:hypothetical protein